VTKTGETGGFMALGAIVLASGAVFAGALAIRRKRSI